MRVLVLVAVSALLLVVPGAAAEWGAYGPDGWPVNVDGESTNPYPGLVAVPGMAPLNEVLGFTVYPYWPLLTAEVTRLSMEYPDLVKLHSIGKSTAGLDLWMLEIADFANPDMVPLEAREVVWVDGGTHSNEYSGVYFVLHLANFLIEGYGSNETATWIVENRHTWIMPMVNPDGSNLFGRLNAKLVNINRNYPVDWGALNEDPVMNNPGPAAASEIETRLNIEWFNKTRPDYYASVHCCGNLWLYPYGVEGLDPLDNATFARICQEAFPTVVEDCGPIWSTIYPASGSSVDTVYEYTGAAAFGYEMSGRGAISLWGQPLTEAPVEEQEFESWNGVLHAFMNVHLYGGYPETFGQGVGGDRFTIMVRNDGYGPLLNGTLTMTRRDGEGYTATIPTLAPGESADVIIAVDDEYGMWSLDADYQKRFEAESWGHRDLTLFSVEKAGNSGWRIVTVSAEQGWPGLEEARDGPNALDIPADKATPTVALPAALGLLVGVVGLLARRRRTA